MSKIQKLIRSVLNKETILYLVFGVLTTVLGFVSLKLFDILLGQSLYLISNSLSWVVCVIFAYITNKLFVFESKSWSFSVLKKEVPSFFASRVFSYFVEQASLWFMMDVLMFKERIFGFILFDLSGLMTAKLIVGVLVVIINYIFSKLLIFKNKKQ